jgi:MFS family permease
MRPETSASRYPAYVLGVLVVVYVFNFLDRQILSILAERIKADLGLTDAQIGFLYGTAFAVFYAIFGIPLGRLADVWDRRRLIALGLAAWSCMTALSGLARTFGHLAAARIGVGIGEASATPAAFSLLSDYFPPARRATVLALYSSGIYIGAGVGLGIGGLIVNRWDAAWAGTMPPFGLRGWQVAFFAVGLPGLVLALVVRTLREPVRGQADGIFAAPEPHPLRAFLRELGAVLPPLTLVNLGLQGARHAAVNLCAALGIAVGALLVTRALGNPAQWIALGVGLYAAVSWAQALRLRDPVAFTLVFRTRSLQLSALAFSFLAFTGYALGFWVPPFFVRVHGVSETQAGLLLGATSAAAGWLGATMGGVLADRWRQRTPAGRLHLAMLTATLPLPFAIGTLTTESTAMAYVLNVPAIALQSTWLGAGASTLQDLVLPRMRATAAAAYLLLLTFVGLALGPYTIGRLSVALGDLRVAMLIGLSANVFALACRPPRAISRATRRPSSSGRVPPASTCPAEPPFTRRGGDGATRPRAPVPSRPRRAPRMERARHVDEAHVVLARRERDRAQQVVRAQERTRLAVDLDAPAGPIEVGEDEQRGLRRARRDLHPLLCRDHDAGRRRDGRASAAGRRHGTRDDRLAARIEPRVVHAGERAPRVGHGAPARHEPRARQGGRVLVDARVAVGVHLPEAVHRLAGPARAGGDDHVPHGEHVEERPSAALRRRVVRPQKSGSSTFPPTGARSAWHARRERLVVLTTFSP